MKSFQNRYLPIVSLLLIFINLKNSESVSMQRRRLPFKGSFQNTIDEISGNFERKKLRDNNDGDENFMTTLSPDIVFEDSTSSALDELENSPTTIFPLSENENVKLYGHGALRKDRKMSHTIPKSSNLKTLSKKSSDGGVNFHELSSILEEKKKECNSKNHAKKQSKFSCEKLKLSHWLLEETDKNETEVLSSYVQFVKSSHLNFTKNDELEPESYGERVVYRFITSHGEPVDKLLFYQLKKYVKSRELAISVPHLVNMKISPRTHVESSTGRTLFDPGFNLKLKLPFFHDELKVAVSTGPSFLAGLGVGLVVLGIKAMFAPLIFAFKAMIFSYFFKDMSPLDIMKSVTSPLLPSWLAPEPHLPSWEQSIEHFEPHISGPESYFDKKHKSGGGGIMSAISALYPFGDQAHEYTNIEHMLKNRPHPPPNHHSTHSYHGGPPQNFYNSGPSQYNSQLDSEGRTQLGRPLENFQPPPPPQPSPPNVDVLSQNYNNIEEPSGFNNNPPSVVPLDEHFDPFYTPLLSRIDSIFMHLGFNEEGCKERAVCSIYKFPVKYAPYSNLLSAQLSKHQSELKRPVNTSPKVLRYFKYMKAAKDGQGALNCIELYPKCSSETEKLTNLPMVKTFQQLTELMGNSRSGK